MITPTNSFENIGLQDTQEQFPSAFGVAPKELPGSVTINKKAETIMLGMGPEDKDVSQAQVTTMLGNGEEGSLRKRLAANEDAAVFQARQTILQEMVRNRQNGQISPEEYNMVMGLSSQELANPDTIVEKKAARKIVDTTLARDGGEKYNEALTHDTEKTDTLVGEYERKSQYSNALKDIVTDLEDRASKQGWVGWSADLAKGLFVPFYNTYKRSGVSSESGNLAERMLFPGATFAAERERLFSLPTVEEFKSQARESLDKVAADNPQLAADFAKELMDFSISQQFWTSTMGALDIPIAGEIAVKGVKGVTKGVKAVTGVSRAVEDTVDTVKSVARTVAHPNATKKDAVAATGDVKKAAETALMTEPETMVPKFSDAVRPGAPTEDVAKWIEGHVPSIAVPDAAFPDTPFDAAKGYVANLREVLRENSNLALKAVFDTNMVSRIDKTAAYESGAVEQAHKAVKEIFGENTSNAIVDTRFIPGSVTGVNVDKVVVSLGKPDGSLFDTEKSARAAVKRTYGLNVTPEALEVTKVGDKYAVSFSKEVNELDPAMRDLVLHADNKTPVSTVKMFLGHITSADQNLSKGQNQVRSVATSVQGEMERLIGEMAQPIGQLDKKESNKLFQLMDDAAARIKKMPDGTLSRGKFFRSQQEFAAEYFTKFGEYPSAGQTKAYFTAVQLSDLDYLFRNLNLYQQKASRGIGQLEFPIQIASKTEEGAFERITTKPIEGLYVDRLPLDSGEASRILVIEKNGTHNVIDTKKIAIEQKNILENYVKTSNSRVAKIFDPASHPLRDYLPNYKEGYPIEYVVSPNSKWSNLSMTQVPYNEGGHAIEDAAWRVKSPRMVPTTEGRMYGGDSTFSAHVIEREAREFAQDMEAGRLALKEATAAKVGKKPIDLSGVQKVLEERGLPFSAKEFAEFFGKDGVLDPTMPISVVRDGQKYSDVVDLGSMNVRNYMNSPHNMASEIDRKFTSERGLGSQSFARGGANSPAWTPVKARMLDSKRVIQRTLSEVLRSRVYSDYVQRSANEFVEQFGDLLAGGREKARGAPIYNLLHPQWKTNADPVTLAAAKKMQRATSLLVYSPSEMSKQVSAAKNAVLNSVYSKFGGKAAEWVDDSSLFKTRDPTSFLRGVAFHTQIGLFNPVQMVLNTQTLFHMTAISPRHAPGAIKDSILMRFLGVNNSDEILKNLSKKSGYTHFEEMYKEMERSGFAQVGSTVAHLDTALEPKTVTGKFGAFLDFATIFFKESEGGLKRSAYSIAYREWRDTNPKAVINDLARQRILQRAKNLNVQMTRDSQNLYQHGVWSIPLQFSSYYLRMAEQLMEGIATGKGALSRGEALRATAMYSTLYGFPTSVGAVIGAWPVYDSVKQYALENGVDLDANAFTEFVSRGLFHVLASKIDGQKWNFAERWGPGNSSLISDILEGNTSLVEAAMGPSGSVASNIIQTGAPLLRALGSVFSDDPEASYPLTMNDLLGVARSIGTVNNATRAYIAYNTGLWVTKSGVVQTEVDNSQVLFAALLGLSPQEAADAFPATKVLAERSKYKDQVVKEARKEWDLYTTNLRNDNKQAAEDHLKRMKFLIIGSGLNEIEKNELMVKTIQAAGTQWDELEMKLIQGSKTPEEYRRRIEQRANKLNSGAKN